MFGKDYYRWNELIGMFSADIKRRSFSLFLCIIPFLCLSPCLCPLMLFPIPFLCLTYRHPFSLNTAKVVGCPQERLECVGYCCKYRLLQWGRRISFYLLFIFPRSRLCRRGIVRPHIWFLLYCCCCWWWWWWWLWLWWWWWCCCCLCFCYYHFLIFALFCVFFYLLNFNSREKTLVSFMHWPLCPWGKGPSACRPGGWVDPTPRLEALEKETIYFPYLKSLLPSL